MKTKISEIGSTLKNWNDVDETLKNIADLEYKIGEKEAIMNAEMDKIKKQFQGILEPIQQQKMRLEKDVKDFCEFHREDFGDQKSKKLNYGSVGYRASQSLKTMTRWTWEKVLQKLEAVGKTEFVRIKKDVDKSKIRDAGLSDAELKMLGMKLEKKETFWYEIDYDRINFFDAA